MSDRPDEWCDELYPLAQPWEIEESEVRCSEVGAHALCRVLVPGPCPDCSGIVQHSTSCPDSDATTVDCSYRQWRPTTAMSDPEWEEVEAKQAAWETDSELLDEIKARRADPEFMARLDRIMREEKHILDRLAADD